MATSARASDSGRSHGERDAVAPGAPPPRIAVNVSPVSGWWTTATSGPSSSSHAIETANVGWP